MNLVSFLFLFIGLLIGATVIFCILNKKIQEKINEIRSLSNDLSAKATENSLLNKRIEEDNKKYKEQQQELVERYEKEKNEENERHEKQLKQQLAMMEERVTNLTQDILNKRSRQLDESNQQQMGTIIAPLKDTMERMRVAINDSNIRNAENTSSLKEQIKNLLESTQNIGKEADKLSNALHSKTKVQGNFGEMVLSELLERFGFREGIEYDVQETLKDKNGKVIINEDTNGRMITDVILHYPDGKDVIIDSKVSLTAFTNYVNAETEEEKEMFLKQHIQSIKNQADILSKKDYSSYANKSRVALDFVIMFVPIESALVLALSNATTLWREAFDKKVFITGEQNLFAVLRMIQLAWTQKQQNDNQRKIYDLAETFLKRVGEFNKRFENIGSQIEKVQQVYDDARKKFSEGRQNLIKPAQDMVKMGAKEDKQYSLPKLDDDNEE